MEQIILFAPLVAAIIAGFGWRIIGDQAAQWLTTGILFLICLLSWIVFFGHDGTTQHIEVMRWIQSGTLDTSWGIRMDRLTAIMLIVVTTVSALVHLYSMGYMAHDENFSEKESYRPRFFAYLSFFTFAMLMLVTADNLVQMFFGWEGVGVASYLLIGFYYKKPSANAAAIKAFVVNRVGDFGFALGIFGLFFLVDSIMLDDIFAAGPMLAETQLTFLWTEWNAANLLAFLLFVGAMGKSAQLFLHTWLPDAMEGPTPVSALIHAATMVTAGVFLVCRMSPLMEFAPEAKMIVVYIGAMTAFFAATVGLVQNDIKRVIAYSTCSQLGYMFVAAGVGVYSVAMFHLFTHAFFKAMLFLGAGSVIHAMHHEQDMRNYGGLRKKIPYTFWAMMVGTLAITGVGIPLTHIGFAGFLSKDAVIESAWAGTDAGFAFWALVIAALFTSFYSWRLMFMTFYGKPRGDKHTHEHAHESPVVMLIPLGVLGLGAIFAGMIWFGSFFGDHDEVNRFYGIPEQHAEASEDAATMAGVAPQGAIFMAPDNHVMDDAHHAPKWVKVSPFIAMLIGLVVALWFYVLDPKMPRRVAEANRPLYLFLLNKWYFDEIYDFVLVRPTKAVGRFLWKRGDGGAIDGTINGVAMGAIPWVTRLAGRAQSGYIFTYAFAMVIGIVILVTWMALGGGAQ
ncbi:NADH-quinone oxidoreductase subunit L [Aquicoccus porphyridii]|uniref:NADH-quinone oxidoreductase subunit L n=1 Tax=Aquicoccus porphyridii TaxID=1852029 RepID=A0A5A9ZC20_9RHOB|nr:NADH-quinone oxidoreductase subunit L [Aquicoccus porphyridii]KAA0914757.1 NADH-quinone oxidoreductase subunit L [Aquicoccus porphyridii]RAI53372.1 NADH-quinone oxidoreductase subunit L [Rhodobacteraceae bacterium AsT-22]